MNEKNWKKTIKIKHDPRALNMPIGERIEYLMKAIRVVDKAIKKIGGTIGDDFTVSATTPSDGPIKATLELSFNLSSLLKFFPPDTGQD